MTYRNLVRHIIKCAICGVSYIPDNGEICACIESEYEPDRIEHATDTTFFTE